MKFLIDENIGLEVAEYLTREGHNIKKVPSGMKNGEVIKLALREKRILFTNDLHFSNILMYPPHKYCGIIRFKIHPPRAERQIGALKRLLSEFHSASEFDKRLFAIEENDFRVRK